MIFTTRVKRGATRAFALVHYKFDQIRSYRPNINWQVTQKTLLSLLVIRSVLPPLPVAAPALAAGLDDTEPPRLVRITPQVVSALTFSTKTEEGLTVSVPTLQPITVGESIATQQAEAAAAAAAQAAAQAAAVAAQQKALEAQRAATIQISLADAVAPSYDVDAIKDVIRAAAAEYGVDADLMLRIAQCESGFNPHSYNASGASGLFQFMRGTFENSDAARNGGSIWDPQANAEAAAYKIANGGLSAWSASESCWDN